MDFFAREQYNPRRNILSEVHFLGHEQNITTHTNIAVYIYIFKKFNVVTRSSCRTTEMSDNWDVGQLNSTA